MRLRSLVVAACALTSQAAFGTCSPSFSPTAISMPNQNNNAVVAADFNHDGVPDIATPNLSSPSQILVAPGLGGGNFGAPASYPGPADALDIGMGDFDNDGNLDIVASGYDGIEILYGNGAGQFTPQFLAGGNIEPHYLAVGNLNGDSIPDVLIDGSQPRVFLGANGGVVQSVNITAGSRPAIGDINNDGRADLVYSTPFTLFASLNQGNLVFSPPQLVAPGFAKFSALADLNSDGNLDVAYTGALGVVSVALGSGDGTFAAPTSYPATNGGGQVFVSIGDLNGDTRPDLVVHSESDFDAVFLLNTGGGAFAPQQHFAVQGPYNRAVFADVDGNADLDVVFARYHGGVIAFLNTCSGPAVEIPTLHPSMITLLAALLIALGAMTIR